MNSNYNIKNIKLINQSMRIKSFARIFNFKNII